MLSKYCTQIQSKSTNYNNIPPKFSLFFFIAFQHMQTIPKLMAIFHGEFHAKNHYLTGNISYLPILLYWYYQFQSIPLDVLGF